MTHPCKVCLELKNRVHLERSRSPDVIQVRTWCLICGHAALLELSPVYHLARQTLLSLHKQPMFHAGGNHKEEGGWGVHWRFDEVLAVAFKDEYQKDPTAPFWPKAEWSVFSHVLEKPVERVYTIPGRRVSLTEAEARRHQLAEAICSLSKDRLQLEQENGQVWDEPRLARDYEVIGKIIPFVIVIERVSGLRGTLLFQDSPRYYFSFSTTRII